MLEIFLVRPDPTYFPLLKWFGTPISVLATQDFPPPGGPTEMILIVYELSIRFLLIIKFILRQFLSHNRTNSSSSSPRHVCQLMLQGRYLPIGGSYDLLEIFILLFHCLNQDLELFSPLSTLGVIELLEVARELLKDGLCSDV